jgi:1-acyl-sn-glycerol-3-phosphate acyltransferase
MMYFLARNTSLWILRFFFRFKIQGLSHFPKKGGFILAGNHVSFLDPPVFSAASPRPLHFMARDTLFRHWLFGPFIHAANAFPVKRRAIDMGALREAFKRLKKDGLLIFPEGTRRVDGKVGKGFAGVGFLARKSGLPVVPAYVFGTDYAMPKNAKGIRFCQIRVVFGKPMTFPLGNGLSDEEFSALVMKEITALGSHI